ncbi:MAG: hypothetical protein VCB26_11790 [Candidatus Hydrogenedentota bacterium]
MKKVMKVITLGLIVAVATAIAPVANIFAADVALSGEPVDMVCYMDGKSGAGHASCATACAKKGNPIGLVVKEDGKSVLYLVLAAGGKASKDLMAAHMGKIVDVTGKTSKKDGMNIIMALTVSPEGFSDAPAEAASKADIPKVNLGGKTSDDSNTKADIPKFDLGNKDN